MDEEDLLHLEMRYGFTREHALTLAALTEHYSHITLIAALRDTRPEEESES